MDESLIEIEGDADALKAARATDGLTIDDHGQRPLGANRYRVSGRATDAAIAALRARGLTVRVIQTAEELRRHLDRLGRDQDGDGGT